MNAFFFKNSRIFRVGGAVLLAMLFAAIGTGYAGERVFMKGDSWIGNQTEDQLSDFTMVRLSTYPWRTRAEMKRITDPNGLNRKLMLGLCDSLVPPDNAWALDVLSAYNSGQGPLKAFEDSLTAWKNDGVKISAVHYNLEVNAASFDADTAYVSAMFARMLHKYKEILRTAYSDTTKLWVYSRAHNANFWEYGRGCDWDSLTTGPNAIDVCYISGSPLNILPEYMAWSQQGITDDIANTHSVSNGKPVAFQVSTYGIDYSENPPPDAEVYEQNRDSYHIYWENFKTLVRRAKAALDSVNGSDSPITWYQLHYKNVEGNYEYTQDSAGDAPTTDIPWDDGQPYPARLWKIGGTPWSWDQVANQWEVEFIANFLVGTGYSLPGRQITTSTTWDSVVTLIGDVEITNGATLTISPGTTIRFRPDTDVYEYAPSGGDAQQAEILIQSGTLSANASGGSQIMLQVAPADSGLWFGIRNLGGSLTLKNCLVRDADVGVSVASGASGATVQDCEFTDNNQCIVALRAISTISGNHITTSSQGIYLDHDNSQDIEHNLIYNNQNEAICALSEPTVNVTNNTFDGNLYGLRLDDPGVGGPMSMAVLNTILTNNTYGIYTSGYADLTQRYSDAWNNWVTYSGDLSWSSNPPNGESGNEGNINDNPDFVYPSGGNYHLSTGSPCIDTGDPWMNDPDHSRIDMGRYGGTSGAPKPAIAPTVTPDPNLPDTFAVSQNSPNPFNPSTTIDYALPMQAHVVLKIYNVLGQEVRTLVNGVVLPGYYQAVWDGRDAFGRPVSSGVYIYKIQAGTFLAVRKMIMLK